MRPVLKKYKNFANITLQNQKHHLSTHITKQKYLLSALVLTAVSLYVASNIDQRLQATISAVYFLVIPASFTFFAAKLAYWGKESIFENRHYLLIAVGVLATSAEILWLIYEEILLVKSFPLEADLLRIGSYASLIWFLHIYLKPIRKTTPKTIKMFCAIIANAFMIPTLVGAYLLNSNLAPVELITGLAYPIGDSVILFTTLTAMLALYRKKNIAFLISILFSAICFSVSDTTFLFMPETYATASLFDAGWLFGYVVLTFGILKYRPLGKKDVFTNHVYLEKGKIINTVDFEPTIKFIIPASVISVITATLFFIKLGMNLTERGIYVPNFDIYVIIGALSSLSVIALFINKNLVFLVKKRTHELELEQDSLKVQISENQKLLKKESELRATADLLVVDLKNALDRMTESESKYRGIYDGSLDLFRTINTEGVIIDCNKAYAEHFGYVKDEVIGRHVFDFVDKDNLENLRVMLEEWKKMGVVENQQIWLKRKDGSIFLGLVSANSIYDSGGKLIGSNTTIRDITEIYESRRKLEESEKKIRGQLEKLVKLGNSKDEFVAMITHELKTPLVPIISYIDLLLAQKVGSINDEQKKRLEIIKSSAVLLRKIVSDLLDVQKIELGQLKLEKGLFNITEIIKSVITKMGPTAARKGIVLSCDATQNIMCLCDRVRIEQVLTNLISNSLDFCPSEIGKIKIIHQLADGVIKVIVKDNGIGIAKDKLDKLFVKFYQIQTGSTREHSGTGLGLAVCRGIIEAHDGKIWAESDGPGTGTEIHIVLPVTKAPDQS